MWKLTTVSLDDPEEERVFPSQDDAIDYAVVWFVSGYNPEDGGVEGVPAGLASYTMLLIQDLAEGREFVCSLFCERVTLEKVIAA